MTYKEIYDLAMPKAKREQEKMNIWVYLAVRPLSIFATMPFINTNVKPTTITKWSVWCSIIAFALYSFDASMSMKIAGWVFFFIWAVLDGVDGNLARCVNKCSAFGELWDATGGYAAMVLMYFSAGMAAFYDNNLWDFCENYWLLILGGATALFSIFPRLIMHKRKNTGIEDKKTENISNKSKFGLKQIIALNFVSASGFLQVILLAATITHTLNIFIAVYFIINLVIMLLGLRSLLKQ